MNCMLNFECELPNKVMGWQMWIFFEKIKCCNFFNYRLCLLWEFLQQSLSNQKDRRTQQGMHWVFLVLILKTFFFPLKRSWVKDRRGEDSESERLQIREFCRILNILLLFIITYFLSNIKHYYWIFKSLQISFIAWSLSKGRWEGNLIAFYICSHHMYFSF